MPQVAKFASSPSEISGEEGIRGVTVTYSPAWLRRRQMVTKIKYTLLFPKAVPGEEPGNNFVRTPFLQLLHSERAQEDSNLPHLPHQGSESDNDLRSVRSIDPSKFSLVCIDLIIYQTKCPQHAPCKYIKQITK